MTHQREHRRRALLGVALAALGVVSAFLATVSRVMPLGLLGALALFVTGLIVVETALFRALHETFEDAPVHESPVWSVTVPAE